MRLRCRHRARRHWLWGRSGRRNTRAVPTRRILTILASSPCGICASSYQNNSYFVFSTTVWGSRTGPVPHASYCQAPRNQRGHLAPALRVIRWVCVEAECNAEDGHPTTADLLSSLEWGMCRDSRDRQNHGWQPAEFVVTFLRATCADWI
jgi:hypothetical protein